jgi:predicted acyl esterase
VLSVQHGVGDRGARNPVTGETIAGPETLTEDELKKNREDLSGEALRRPLLDDYYRARIPDFSKIEVPLLSAANWGGQGLHPRGNYEGYLRAGSREKWLEVHGDTHFTHFYSDYGAALQKRFFGHFLKGENTGWNQQPRVSLNVRRPGEHFTLRAENEWPLARTQWAKYYLDPAQRVLGTAQPDAATTIAYQTSSDGVTFLTPPMKDELEITGPLAVKLWVSSDTTDADLFIALRVFDRTGKEVVFIGSNDPRTPVALGWLRASHRKLDPAQSLPYRPIHTHDEKMPLTPGVPVELDVEVWPTSIVVPPGYRLGLSVRGRDYEYDGTDLSLPNAAYPMKGVGPFTHTHPEDRPQAIFGGTNTLHFAAGTMPYVLLPVIPSTA